MKNIYLIRHAEAENAIGMKDIERRLTDNGKKTIEHVTIKIKETYPKPDMIFVSPAKRTQQTAEIIKNTWACDDTCCKTEDFLYECTYQDVFRFLQNLSEQYTTIAIVGHNPTLSALVNFLTGESINLAPANVCVIEFNVDIWAELFAHAGQLKGLY